LTGTITDPRRPRGKLLWSGEMIISMNLEHLGNGTVAVTGVLKTGVKSEEGGAQPHMVLEMTSQSNETVKISLDQLDISTIVRLATKSKISKLREAVTSPKP
jgi:hypothetical protein